MYIQGSEHFRLHDWWHGPMTELLGLWAQLSERVPVHVATLHDATHGIEETVEGGNGKEGEEEGEGEGPGPAARKARKQLIKRKKRCLTVDASSFEALISGLEERQTKREGWQARERDPAFYNVPVNCRPMPVPFPPCSGDVEGRPDTPAAQAGLDKMVRRLRTLQHKYAALPQAGKE
jgi:hypothetical protein